MKEFDAFDAITAPDQWDEIVDRANRPEARSVPTGANALRRAPSPRWLAVSVAAAIAVVVAAGVWVDGDDQSPDPDRRVAATRGDEPVIVTCPDGAIRGTTVPADAAHEQSLTNREVAGRQARSWRADGLRYELLVPGISYIDFVGERTEDVDEPRGMLYFEEARTHFLGATGFVGACERFEVIVEGRDEAARRSALLDVVSGFAFDPSLGVTDCGASSRSPLQVTRGDTVLAAVRTLEVADILLTSRVYGRGLPTVARTGGPDGWCEVVVGAYGGLQPIATISGTGGVYALESLRGFAPHGIASDEGTIQLDDVGLGVSVQGTRFTVAAEFWCDDCTRATLTIHYPDDDITAKVTRTSDGVFTGDLPRPSTPGSPGWIAILWEGGEEGRGVLTAQITGGDFAAG